MAMKQMQTLTINAIQYEISDKVARDSVDTLRNDVDDIIAESLRDFTGATSVSAGTSGMVPAPRIDEREKYLKGDGTWAEAANKEVEDSVSSLFLSMNQIQNMVVPITTDEINEICSNAFDDQESL